MSKDLIISLSDSEISIALLEEKQLVELNKEKRNVQFSVGDIYLGKVKKIMPGLNAAFINVGFEKDAFLHYLDLGAQFKTLHHYYNLATQNRGRLPAVSKFKSEPDIDKEGKISDVLTTGQTVIVQITKEPISTKGPRLASEVSIAGRNLVLMPFSDKVSVSSKIENADERNRLRMLIQSIKPKNYGVIVRTVAEGKKVAILDVELKELINRWETALYAIRKDTKTPKLLVGERNRTTTILRDILNPDFSNVIVDDEVMAADIRSYIREIAPEKEKIVKLYKEQVHIFDHFGVSRQIKGLFGRTISFKGGSYLIIEHTEALHVIDVNSGNRSKSGNDQEANALSVNQEAAREISRQLRLRDMGGIIVIDFIDMQSNENRQALFESMKELMSEDRAKHNILPLSKFGLMQITRQRVRPEMTISTDEKCPVCRGEGKIGPTVLLTDEIERRLVQILERVKTSRLLLRVHPFVAAYLKEGLFSVIGKINKKYKVSIKVQGSLSYHFLEYCFFDRQGNEIDLS
ncbi:MAG: Rne/Rng family ribonuclease [Bacteroidia bacterium]|nr:MAG: Rne/Rng family ribonuclease [Bacteroidia bacterium]